MSPPQALAREPERRPCQRPWPQGTPRSAADGRGGAAGAPPPTTIWSTDQRQEPRLPGPRSSPADTFQPGVSAAAFLVRAKGPFQGTRLSSGSSKHEGRALPPSSSVSALKYPSSLRQLPGRFAGFAVAGGAAFPDGFVTPSLGRAWKPLDAKDGAPTKRQRDHAAAATAARARAGAARPRAVSATIRAGCPAR